GQGADRSLSKRPGEGLEGSDQERTPNLEPVPSRSVFVALFHGTRRPAPCLLPTDDVVLLLPRWKLLDFRPPAMGEHENLVPKHVPQPCNPLSHTVCRSQFFPVIGMIEHGPLVSL